MTHSSSWFIHADGNLLHNTSPCTRKCLCPTQNLYKHLASAYSQWSTPKRPTTHDPKNVSLRKPMPISTDTPINGGEHLDNHQIIGTMMIKWEFAFSQYFQTNPGWTTQRRPHNPRTIQVNFYADWCPHCRNTLELGVVLLLNCVVLKTLLGSKPILVSFGFQQWHNNRFWTRGSRFWFWTLTTLNTQKRSKHQPIMTASIPLFLQGPTVCTNPSAVSFLSFPRGRFRKVTKTALNLSITDGFVRTGPPF